MSTLAASFASPLRVGFAAAALCLFAACAKGEGGAPASSTSPASSPPPPAAVSTAAATRPSDVVQTAHGDLRIMPLHHATMLLQFGEQALYFDPVHDAKYDGLPKADLVFITDIHPDHLDPAGLDLVRKPSTTLIVPPAVAEKLPAGLPNVIVLKNGESRTVAGIGVDAVPMYNLTRGPAPDKRYHDKGRGDGFVLTVGGKRLYVSGDTECTPEMKALKDIDIAFVCMNLPYTMPAGEAAECVNAFKPKVVYPYHYRGTDLAEFQKAVPASSGIDVRVRDWYAP